MVYGDICFRRRRHAVLMPAFAEYSLTGGLVRRRAVGPAVVAREADRSTDCVEAPQV